MNMNLASKMLLENQLKTNLTYWILSHGTILSDRSYSNGYVKMRFLKIVWKDCLWKILQVDGMTCQIEKVFSS